MNNKIALEADQQRTLVGCRIEEDPRANHAWISVRLDGPVDPVRLQKAVTRVRQRHDVLRARLATDEQEATVELLDSTEFPIIAIPKSTGGLEAWAARAVGRRFEEEEPWGRIESICLSDNKYGLVIVLPRAGADDNALQIIFDDLVQAYADQPLSDPEQIHGLAYFAETAPKKGDSLKDLHDACAPLQGELPSLDLPTDGTRPILFSGKGRHVSFELDQATLSELARAASSLNVTPQEVQLTVYVALLQRFANQQDATIGLTGTNRSFRAVAPLSTRRVMRACIAATTPLGEATKRIALDFQAAQHAASVPYQDIVQELCLAHDPSRTALYQAAFETQTIASTHRETNDVRFTPFTLHESGASTDLTLRIVTKPDGAQVQLHYASDILSLETAECMLDSYHAGLKSFAQSIALPLGKLPLLTPEQKKRSMAPLHRKQYDAQQPAFLVFGSRAKQLPDATAVVMHEDKLTYGQLDEASNRLAHRLIETGVSRDVLVGIYCDRSIDMLVALLAIHKAGGAYVPLDPKHPSSRVEAILEDANPKVLITQSHLKTSCPTTDDVVLLATDDPGLEQESAIAPEINFDPDSLAYVLFTSGSTGRPKGVEITHRSFTNFINSMAHRPGMKASDRILSVTTLSFDIVGLELLLPLFVGASVEIADYETCIDPEKLIQRASNPAITMLQGTPTTFRMLVESNWQGAERLKILCGGEAFPPDLMHSLLAIVGEVWNGYGPTEATVYSTFSKLASDKLPVPIGTPTDNTPIYILNPCQEPVPFGAVGEIWVGGDGVARGYRGRDDLTAERFLDDPFSPEKGARMYQSGDLGRWGANDEFICLGRTDFQVKIRGFRIELGDIESTLLEEPDITRTVVVAREDVPGDKRLVAYVVGGGDSSTLATRLRDTLATKLPSYMVPAAFVSMPELPLNPSGKVDRKALPRPDQSSELSTQQLLEDTAIADDTEAAIRAAFNEVLGTNQIATTESFFDAGGNSLLAVRLIRTLEASLGIPVPLALLFETSTIRGIAQALQKTTAETDHSRVVVLRKGTSDRSVFCIYGVALYQHLARSLPEDLTVYGIFVPAETKIFEPENLRQGKLDFPSISELAHIYLQAIRKVQPEGPYQIIGISFGGIVAYEAARILKDEGQQVALLGLLDSLLPQSNQSGPAKRIGQHLRNFVTNKNAWGAMTKLARGRLGIAPTSEFSENELEWLRDRIHEEQIQRYASTEQSYQGDAVVVHAEDRSDFGKGSKIDASAGWNEWVKGTLSEYTVAGKHLGIIQPPNSSTLADKLASHINAGLYSGKNSNVIEQ